MLREFLKGVWRFLRRRDSESACCLIITAAWWLDKSDEKQLADYFKALYELK